VRERPFQAESSMMAVHVSRHVLMTILVTLVVVEKTVEANKAAARARGGSSTRTRSG